ncbi:proline-rich protein 22-like [Cyrtonyx montezumae]|uniref:proline-rich protein 22-like n=1 Tax=Cyrtonyx montezumae TaxID=9017 RepID=UPI0032DB9760
MWRAPCGCYFDLRVFRLQWTNTAVPPPANPTSQPWMPSNGCAALQSWVTPTAPPEQFVPYTEQGIAVAPVVPSVPTFQHLEGQIQYLNIAEAAPGGSSGIPMGDAVPLHSNIPAGTFSAPSPQETENSRDSLDIDLPEEVLLEEAMRLFNCSPEMLSGSDSEPQGINHGLPSSIPVLQDLGDLSDLNETISSHSMSSLSLPREVLSCDYSVPEASSMKLSTEQLNHVWMCPKEARQDLTLSETLLAMPRGDELQLKAKSEKRGKKERSSFLMRKSHKERVSPCSCGVEEQG